VFFLQGVQTVEYADPWAWSQAERVARLKRQRPHRVAYLYDEVDNSTFRYRVYNMIQALDTRPDVAATYFTGKELALVGELLDDLDVLVVVRFRYSHGLNHLVTLARQRGKRVLFDIDDLIFDVDYVHLILNTLDQELYPEAWDSWFAYAARQGAALKLCDGTIATNATLAARQESFSSKPARIVPNFMNKEQLALSQALYRAKRSGGFQRSPQIHLGYFSGTPTHNLDLELAAGAIAGLLERRRDVVLRIVGFMELRGRLAGFASRVERIGFVDFLNLQRLVAEVELNLMPLQNNIFTSCKSELKYFEAGIVGTISVASSVGTYRDAIRDGDTGFLARDFEWGEKLDEALGALDRYAELAERAQADCEERHAWTRYVDVIFDALFAERG
jgi:glycosyltransferase involved in cell wall biosynthesis